jgi:hypothetical protein
MDDSLNKKANLFKRVTEKYKDFAPALGEDPTMIFPEHVAEAYPDKAQINALALEKLKAERPDIPFDELLKMHDATKAEFPRELEQREEHINRSGLSDTFRALASNPDPAAKGARTAVQEQAMEQYNAPMPVDTNADPELEAKFRAYYRQKRMEAEAAAEAEAKRQKEEILKQQMAQAYPELSHVKEGVDLLDYRKKRP